MSDQRTKDHDNDDAEAPSAASRSARAPVLVTGAAGFIGFHLCRRLLERGDAVVGIDNLNDYYDVGLKEARRDLLVGEPRFDFVYGDLADRDAVADLFRDRSPRHVVHLAAQAGVRYSLENPHAYVESNLVGFVNVLEGCRHHDAEHLVFASSSSVYGADATVPFSTAERADRPVSLYAATKRSNELMAYTYAHLFGLPATGLRFFTVYGPWGRPDMAYFSFTRAVLEGRPIDVYNQGRMWRDFTYVDDLVRGIRLLLDAVPGGAETAVEGDSLSPVAPFRVVNIGNSRKESLEDFIAAIEAATGCLAQRNYMEMQPGDVPATWADASLLQRLTGYRSQTGMREGVARFVAWYRGHYGV